MVSRGELSMAKWRKSSRSDSASGCVAIAAVGNVVAVRDSKDPDALTITLSRLKLRSFILATKAGKYDL
jgi:hypothetical protein